MSARYQSVAVVGAGATTLYFLKNVLDQLAALRRGVGLERIVVFERGDRAGMGMPYNPKTTDQHNICNISSEELPPLQQSFASWLRGLDDRRLADFDLSRDEIDPAETYARIALGGYFEAQFHAVCDALRDAGLDLQVRLNTPVDDVIDDPDANRVRVRTHSGGEEAFDCAVIATGHNLVEGDRPEHGYFASPWPIGKLLPRDGEHFNFAIGTLGASLSAFDVVASLAHRHGNFEGAGAATRFEPDPAAPQFRIAMHSGQGWLPHLQYQQAEPMREVYRHVEKERLLSLRDAKGFLRLDAYFDAVCRPALAAALRADGRDDIAEPLADGSMSLQAFVEQMEGEHTYDDPFAGMRQELPEARRSLDQNRPIHWKEVLDDLMYALNYHARLLPAEDHARLRALVMPFLLNVIAAMPLRSARMLLALRDAGRLELVRGFVTVDDQTDGQTTVSIDDDGETSQRTYRMFVNCSGQDSVSIEEYPFPSLVERGTVRAARARFADPDSAAEIFDKHPDRRIDDGGMPSPAASTASTLTPATA